MTDLAQKELMVQLGLSFYERGYTVGGAGNLSVRLDDNRVLVTPTGSSLGRLSVERLSVLDMEGNLLGAINHRKKQYFIWLCTRKILSAKPLCIYIVPI